MDYGKLLSLSGSFNETTEIELHKAHWKRRQINVDSKLISKTLALRLKNALSSLILPNQTAYVRNRFISESGRLISDTMDVSEQLNIDSYLVTIDIHSFLLAVLKAIGFWKYFSHWIEISLTNQGSCVLNGKTTKKYFKLK